MSDNPPILTTERPVDSVKSASAQDIVALFKWLDFADPLGHSLTHCQDFLDLVDRATSP